LNIDYGYSGKKVIVTGGGGAGMGASAVRKLVDLGAEVHVLDFKAPPVAVASHQAVDLKDPAAITEAVNRIGGPVHALFNCVGVPGNRTTPLDTMLINFAGVRHLTATVVPLMEPGSAVVTVSSNGGAGWMRNLQTWTELAGTDGFDGASAWLQAHRDAYPSPYSGSKEAVIVWTMYAAAELGRKGIRINATMPGPTETPMSPDFVAATSKDFMDSYPIPLGRPQTPDEQADVLLYLNSALASVVTGTALPVDGGGNGGLTTGQLQMPRL
jgi:NAD(P)-dependent dehydrogenase (short-subunit alcohol dehydrogenase family)